RGGALGERLLELDPRIADVPQPPLRVLLETSLEQLPHLRGCALWDRVPIGLSREHRRKRVGDRLALERTIPREQFIEHAAEPPDVGALVDRFPARLLGA